MVVHFVSVCVIKRSQMDWLLFNLEFFLKLILTFFRLLECFSFCSKNTQKTLNFWEWACVIKKKISKVLDRHILQVFFFCFIEFVFFFFLKLQYWPLGVLNRGQWRCLGRRRRVCPVAFDRTSHSNVCAIRFCEVASEVIVFAPEQFCVHYLL